VILYLDTSALVKRYFHEPYSEEVLSRWQEATEIATSSVAYAESLASFYRKKQETAFEDALMDQIVRNLRTDWQSFIRIQVNEELNEHIDKAIEAHPLRGFDAIHLASAMIMHENFQDRLLFACFDRRLNQAAQTEGIHTFPVDSFGI
jgi:predicted nucleic acid-binding protein